MDSDKKTLPPIAFQGPEKPIAKSNKKYFIAAVTVVLILVITLGAVLVTLKFTLGFPSNGIKEYKLQRNIIVKVDIENDITVVDHPEKGYSVHNDFNMAFSVLKLGYNKTFICYLSRLRKGVLSPAAMQSYLEHHPDGEEITSHRKDVDWLHVMPAKEEIRNRGFLGQQVRDTCAGSPIHWLVPAGEEDPDDEDEASEPDEDDEMTGNSHNVTLVREKRHGKSYSIYKCDCTSSSGSSSSCSSSSSSGSSSSGSSSSGGSSRERTDRCYSRKTECRCYLEGSYCCIGCCNPGCGSAPCCYSSGCHCSRGKYDSSSDSSD
ncbi:unnamed protein product [Owenia fusiformis]|uniref:Uncharacterized protein n=1 Tax=Owenia fusiformis TaxID=6347 RepID=A0A8J1TLI5_OWEFU|nr:unnamed protein product [Owenia fusiformis]